MSRRLDRNQLILFYSVVSLLEYLLENMVVMVILVHCPKNNLSLSGMERKYQDIQYLAQKLEIAYCFSTILNRLSFLAEIQIISGTVYEFVDPATTFIIIYTQENLSHGLIGSI